MAKKKSYAHEPDYIVAPGESVLEMFEYLGKSRHEAASALELAPEKFDHLVAGQLPITPELGGKLEQVTKVPATFWNDLEAGYRKNLPVVQQRQRLAKLKSAPVGELVSRGVLDGEGGAKGSIEKLLAFFGVSDLDQWDAAQKTCAVAFRRSEAFQSHEVAIATWLRLGEIEAEKIDCHRFNAEQFRAALAEIRTMTEHLPEQFLPRLGQLCANAGVAFVVVKGFQGAPVSGAARWLSPGKPLIQVSCRNLVNDQLWFTFFHEAGHILLHPDHSLLIDDGELKDALEDEANQFAANILIPSEHECKLPTIRTREQIKAFAASIGIAPGIVLGRLQKEGLVAYDSFHDLKVRFRWKEGTRPPTFTQKD